MPKTQNDLYFYPAKIKLFLEIVLPLPVLLFSIWFIYLAYTIDALVFGIPVLFIVFKLLQFIVPRLIMLVRNHPYLIITKDALLFKPFTRKEETVYFKELGYLRIDQNSLQSMIELRKYEPLVDKKGLKTWDLYLINHRNVQKQEHFALFATLDLIIQTNQQKYPFLMDTENIDTIKKAFIARYTKQFLVKISFFKAILFYFVIG